MVKFYYSRGKQDRKEVYIFQIVGGKIKWRAYSDTYYVADQFSCVTEAIPGVGLSVNTIGGNMVSAEQMLDNTAPPPTSDRGSGLKHDGGKPRWTLLMTGVPKALAGVVSVLTFGAKKYAAHSWKQVENNQERYRDAFYRHLNALESGELVDPESGLPHWDHICCNALFLSEISKDTSSK